MKQVTAITALIAVTALGVFLLAGCPKSGGGPTETAPTPSATEPPVPPAPEVTASEAPENIGNAKNAEGKYVCPVTDEPVTDFSQENSVEHNGKAYFFCCPECKPKFEADPEKYLKAAEAGEASEGSESSEGSTEHEHGEGGEGGT